MAPKPKTIDEYLGALSDDKRAALEKLRKTIRAAAPKAEECISYQLPAFRLNGRMLVGFGATAENAAESGEADGGAQFPELGLLLPGNSQSLPIEILCRLRIPLPQY